MSPIQKNICMVSLLGAITFFIFKPYIYEANLGLSRILQIIVFLSLIIRFSIGYFKVRVPNMFNP